MIKCVIESPTMIMKYIKYNGSTYDMLVICTKSYSWLKMGISMENAIFQ